MFDLIIDIVVSQRLGPLITCVPGKYSVSWKTHHAFLNTLPAGPALTSAYAATLLRPARVPGVEGLGIDAAEGAGIEVFAAGWALPATGTGAATSMDASAMAVHHEFPVPLTNSSSAPLSKMFAASV